MRNAKVCSSWVVYQTPVKGSPEGLTAVCQQEEWEAMELSRPGFFKLIRAGIPNEGEAERLARGTAGDRPNPLKQRRSTADAKLLPPEAGVSPQQPEVSAQQPGVSSQLPPGS